MKFRIPKQFKNFLLVIIIFAIGVGFGYKYLGYTQTKPQVTIEKNTTKAFVGEIYDKIKENYWNNISDAELLDLFKLSINQNNGNVTSAKFENRDKMLDTISKNNLDVAKVASSVLASLAPVGRSGLYTEKQETQLKNTVSNINPEKDLYKDLGLQKGASEAAVQQAFQKLSAGETGEKLKSLTYAKDTLTKKDTKEKYDKAGIEPTIFTKVMNSNILYVQFKKFSPTSLEEFQKAFENYKDVSGLNSLVLDLRGNVGGAIDATAYFLGFFLGRYVLEPRGMTLDCGECQLIFSGIDHQLTRQCR